MIMIVGLPGAGKTTWGISMQKQHPEKRYNIIGSDTLIDKMRVMGLPRKNNYHGRWEVLIDKATKCLNKLFTIGMYNSRYNLHIALFSITANHDFRYYPSSAGCGYLSMCVCIGVLSIVATPFNLQV